MGTCASIYQPTEELKQSMIDGALSSKYTLLTQDPNVLAENFYDPIQVKHPDKGHKVLSCFAGQYSSNTKLQNMPYRGLDSSYTGRWCSKGIKDKDEDDVVIGVTPDSEICNHWPEEELKNIPHMKEHVKEALKFLGKDVSDHLSVHSDLISHYHILTPLLLHYLSIRKMDSSSCMSRAISIGPLTPITWMICLAQCLILMTVSKRLWTGSMREYCLSLL